MPLSSKQCEYLALAWQCMESEPKIDYEKFRQIAGLASAHSARELLRVTKKKLREEYGTGANSNSTSAPSTPRKTTAATIAAGRKSASSTPEGVKKRGRKPSGISNRASTASVLSPLANGGDEGEDDDGDVDHHDDDGEHGGRAAATAAVRADNAAKRFKPSSGHVKSEPADEDMAFDSAAPFE